MNTAIDVLIVFTGLVVAAWVVAFGVLAVLLARPAGVGPAAAFCTGAFLGPVGVTWLWWRGRSPGDELHEPDDPAPGEGFFF